MRTVPLIPRARGGSYSGECTADATAGNGHFAGDFAASTCKSGEIPPSIRGDLAHPKRVIVVSRPGDVARNERDDGRRGGAILSGCVVYGSGESPAPRRGRPGGRGPSSDPGLEALAPGSEDGPQPPRCCHRRRRSHFRSVLPGTPGRRGRRLGRG